MNIEKMLKNQKLPKAVILSSDIYPESENTLTNLGIEVIYSFENKNVHPALSKHVDMQIVSLTDNKIICAPETFGYYSHALKKFPVKLIKGDTYLSSNYPGDIAYNITVTEKCAVHNFKHTDRALMENIGNVDWVDVSQGYCGCTLCKIADDAFITADRGVGKALKEKGYDVLLISGKDILLPGFNEGFIGGSTFMISPNVLCVNGNIKKCPDFGIIVDFCSKYDVEILSLSDNLIMDIGSGICVG